jgi:uncharacterized protein
VPIDATPLWPHSVVDWESLTATGWKSTPLRQFVLKIHQRCNLSCNYCYVYFGPDQSWRDRPALMPEDIRAAAAARIAEHATRHRLTEVAVVLHGGEPLLAGAETLAAVAGQVRAAMPEGTTARISMQTNGTLLTAPALEALAGAGIRIGVSLDGTDAANNANRRYADGRGSADRVRAGLALLGADRYRPLFAGLLCTIDIAADPVACFEALLEHQPPAIDFLLPHANWVNPPERGRHGAWLTALFDRWYRAPVQETRVPLFEAALSLLLGGSSRSEHLGLSPNAAAVVESDGRIEQTDALKTAYPGAAETGLSVLTDDFDAVLRHPGVIARQLGLAGLAAGCQDCALVRHCGAGHYAHRYNPGWGFLGPTVYCDDMKLFLGHVSRQVRADLDRRAARATV